MSKYDPLRDHLMSASGPVEMAFDEVGRIVGGLPPSAYRWQAWWANDRTHVQALAWLGIGRRMERVDLAGRRVTFG